MGVYLGTEETIEFENKRIRTEAMVADDELGLISKRNQITKNIQFKKRERVQAEKISKTLDNVEKEERKEEERNKKIIEGIFDKKTVPDEPTELMFGIDDLDGELNTPQLKDNEDARASNIFSMFNDLLGG